jgi:hypothetical protein
MKLNERIQQTEEMIGVIERQMKAASSIEERAKASAILKTLKIERRQQEKLEKRFSPNQLLAMEAMGEF